MKNKHNIKFTIYFQFSDQNWSQFRNRKNKTKKNKGEKSSDMISLANSHCSKIHSNIKTTHNTQRENTKFCLQLLENWIKNIHIFLKKHFFLLFLNPPLQNIWRHFLSSFCVCICKSFLLFYMFLYKNLSFKTGITGFGECYRYVFF